MILIVLSIQLWYGTYLGNTKIGYLMQDIEDVDTAIIYKEFSFMKLKMMGTERILTAIGDYILQKDYRIKKLNFKLKSLSQELNIDGICKRDTLFLKILTGGTYREKKIPAKGGIYLPHLIYTIAVKRRRPVKLKCIDLTIMGIDWAEARIEKNLGDNTLVWAHFLNAESKALIDKDGFVIKEWAPMNIVNVREEKEKALKVEGAPPEVLTYYAIKPQKKILNPRKVKYLKLKVKGDFLNTDRQKVKWSLFGRILEVRAIEPERENIGRIPDTLLKYLKPTEFVQCDAPEIKQKALEIIKGAKTDWEKVKKILHWVDKNVKDVPSVTMPSAIEVLKNLKGDCNEHAVLFCALARAAGVPAEIVVGIVYINDGFYYHAWNKVWLGKWIEVDPTFGQEIADATHLALQEGGMENQAKIMGIVGKIKIKVIKYEYQ